MSETAYFGGGCFWGIEEIFRTTPGVTATAVGYAGGDATAVTYKQVCSGQTGHAEVVRVEFDPGQIGYAELLAVFFANHDPTQRDRQGPDVGTQYRSLILAVGEAQHEAAIGAIASLGEGGTPGGRPIATVVERYDAEGPARFWKAEDEHQQYLAKRGRSSCRI